MKSISDAGQVCKIIAFSDTHNMHDEIQIDELPQGNILIHCGDFTMDSSRQQLTNFKQFIKQLPYTHKVVVSGNHDFIFDPNSSKNLYSSQQIEEQRQNFNSVCHFLEFQMIQIDGINILGINKGPQYFDWKFSFAKSQGEPIIQKYKDKVDILITHWPPYGILDQISHKQKGGSKGLLQFVRAIKPKMHLFGHIHEKRGHLKQFGIQFYNVSNATKNYDFNSQPFQIILERNKQKTHN